MSKAFKCDHCKKCFDPLEEREGEPNIRIRIDEVWLMDPQHELEHKYIDYFTGIDLCPDCAAEILGWFESGCLLDTDYIREYDNWRREDGN